MTTCRIASLMVACIAGAAVVYPLATSRPAEVNSEPLAVLAERIRPLHMAKIPPRVGDWLDAHKESGQTFKQYLACDPNRPTAKRTTLYIQPLGQFDQTQSRLIDATAELLGRFYNVPVKKLEAMSLDMIPASARRVHPSWGDRQILSGCVLKMLMERRPKDAVAVLALTTSDLWPGRGWNFVFGEATLNQRVGVWSIYRFGDPKKEYPLVLRRTVHTAVHETGHMFSIAHCIAYECGMNGSNSLPESDRNPLPFCPECEAKVWWACHADPAKRYESLIEWGNIHKMKKEADFWAKSLEAIK